MRPQMKSAEVSGTASRSLPEPHAVRSVRETMRRWWGIELGIAGGAGRKAAPVVPAANRICTACLADEDGQRRCVESIRKAIAQAPSGLAGPCHLGLDIAVASLPGGGGFFACGFVVEPRLAAVREGALRGVSALRLPVVDPAEAFERVARIDERDVPRLT
ncbi:MAG: hypothetical protein ACJ79Y_01640, partial [Myxococcales bacterium]